MLYYIKDTQYDIQNMDYLGYPNFKAKKTNVFLHKLIKVYNSYSNKIKKGTKKRFTIGPEAPQCNMRKKPLQRSFTPSSANVCVGSHH